MDAFIMKAEGGQYVCLSKCVLRLYSHNIIIKKRGGDIVDAQVYNSLVSFIWSIADDCLRDVYVRGKYRDVILPMTVIRRLDAVLEDTKDDVLKMKKTLDDSGIIHQNEALCSAAKQSFCNSSPFRLKDLTSRSTQQKLKTDFTAYLDGFSPNVREILKKFKFHVQIDTMADSDILGAVIEKFVSPTINLSPYPVLHDDGSVRLPALDNHTMGTVFEELIRRFNEENNEEAGEHFTPRDVVELMADLIFLPISDKIMDSTYSCYDGASGTGGMLTVSQDRLLSLAAKAGKAVSIHLFGQEINPETYAITRADMLLKGEGSEAENIAYGSTLSDDRFPSRQFDFMLSNPPYGKTWKTDAEKLGGKKGIIDSRFVTSFAGEGEFNMLPRVSDGQLLFLLNNVSKMKESTELGSRIAEVHNGSSLFTGDAGQGESNARRYLIERDLVEAIVALPEKMFYNTGIGTYIWVLSNRKEARRKGKIQLIDATALKSPLRKNLGEKNCELTEELRKQIVDLFLAFEENEYSKIFGNSAFGYWKITVLRPQRGEDGKPLRDKKGKLVPDKDLTDTEQIPLDHPGGVDAFFKAEVLPYAPDAWIDKSKTQIGYEISFTKHFYKPVQLRELADIVADIRALEAETDGLLKEIIRGGN
jgi:type I restriction enzyme M protein